MNGTFTIDASALSGSNKLALDVNSATTFNLVEIGGSSADTLMGGAGTDTLFGNGGADYLTGGTGADIFHFNSSGTGAHITDFESGTDKIQLNVSNTEFSAMVGGWTFTTVSDGVSHSGGTAQATLTYDTQDHVLYYDADGTGTGSAAVAVAHIANAATVTASDIHPVTVDPGH